MAPSSDAKKAPKQPTASKGKTKASDAAEDSRGTNFERLSGPNDVGDDDDDDEFEEAAVSAAAAKKDEAGGDTGTAP